MGEYIEREAAIAALDEFRLNETVSKYATVMQCRAARDAISRAIKVLESLPAADVEPVVRCRECKHLNVLNRKELYAHCPKTNTVFLPFKLDTREHFCSLGERKEGTDNG